MAYEIQQACSVPFQLGKIRSCCRECRHNDHQCPASTNPLLFLPFEKPTYDHTDMVNHHVECGLIQLPFLKSPYSMLTFLGKLINVSNLFTEITTIACFFFRNNIRYRASDPRHHCSSNPVSLVTINIGTTMRYLTKDAKSPQRFPITSTIEQRWCEFEVSRNLSIAFYNSL